MRKLTARDLSKVTRILAKMELRQELADLFKSRETPAEDNPEGKKDKFSYAATIIDIVVSNYEKAETEVFQLLAELSDSTPEAIADLPIETFVGMIGELVSDISFFKSAVAMRRRK